MTFSFSLKPGYQQVFLVRNFLFPVTVFLYAETGRAGFVVG